MCTRRQRRTRRHAAAAVFCQGRRRGFQTEATIWTFSRKLLSTPPALHKEPFLKFFENLNHQVPDFSFPRIYQYPSPA